MRTAQTRETLANKPWKAGKAIRHAGRPNVVKKV